MIKHNSPSLINEDNIQEIIKNLKKSSYKFYQFYNLEIDADESAYIKFMETYKNNTKTKVLNKTYYDIETYVNEKGDFTDPEIVDRPVNSVALYNNIKNIAYVISYVDECNETNPEYIETGIRKLFNEKVEENETYNILEITLDIRIVKDEKELLKQFWEILKDLNTLALIGFNSSKFDDPYMFNRTKKLFGQNEALELISEFGIIEQYGQRFEIPDYLLVDLLQLYKPIDSGGGGLGKSLPDFKLKTVAMKELGITKLDLIGGFRETYLNDIIGYLTYNLFDAILTYKIDEKLRFMELMFDLSEYNNATMSATINGRSILYKYRNNLMYNSQGKIIRSKKFSSEVLYSPEIQQN